MFKFIEKHAITKKNTALAHTLILLNFLLGPLYALIIFAEELSLLILPAIWEITTYYFLFIILTTCLTHALVRLSQGTKGIAETYRILALTSIIPLLYQITSVAFGAIIFALIEFFDLSPEQALNIHFTTIKASYIVITLTTYIILVRALYLFKKIKPINFLLYNLLTTIIIALLAGAVTLAIVISQQP